MNRRFKTKPPPTPYSSDESRSLLSSNLQLQRALGERIQSLSRLKEHNRTSAREVACSITTATATAAIGTAGDDFQSDDAGITGGISNHRVKELLDRRQQRQQQQQQRDAATPSGLSRTAAPAAPIPPHPSATSSKATGVRVKRKRPVETVSSKSTRAWQQNPNRKWHRTYFVDAEGSTPQPNNDVARRAEWLEDVTSSSLPPDILSYTCCNHNEETADDGCRNDESAQEGKCAIANSKKKTEAAEGDTDTRIINSSSRQQQRQTRKKKHKAATCRGNQLTAQQRVSVRTTFVESGGIQTGAASSEQADPLIPLVVPRQRHGIVSNIFRRRLHLCCLRHHQHQHTQQQEQVVLLYMLPMLPLSPRPLQLQRRYRQKILLAVSTMGQRRGLHPPHGGIVSWSSICPH